MERLEAIIIVYFCVGADQHLHRGSGRDNVLDHPDHPHVILEKVGCGEAKSVSACFAMHITA